MKHRIVKGLVSISLCLTCLVSCGKPTGYGLSMNGFDYDNATFEDLVNRCDVLEGKVFDMEVELWDAEVILNEIGNYNKTSTGITCMTDDYGMLSFKSYDSKIVFPEEFVYPYSSQMASNLEIKLNEYFVISPSSGWKMKYGSSLAEMEHETGISALIKINAVEEIVGVEELKTNVLEPWMSQVTSDKVIYSPLFIDGYKRGYQAKTPILIDGEPANLVCGLLGYGDCSVSYTFVYRGETNQMRDETITELLQSIKMYGTGLSIG